MNDPKIVLCEGEIQLARYVARKRTENNIENGTHHQLGNSREEHDAIELLGYGAELAFCRMFNVYPDLTTDCREGSHDCVCRGYEIDVKSTEHVRYGNLIIPLRKGKLPLPDIYVLMVGHFPEYRYIGWEWAKVVIQEENIDRDLPEPAYKWLRKDLKYKIKGE